MKRERLIKPIISAFARSGDTHSIEIERGEEDEYSFSFILKHATVHSETNDRLARLFAPAETMVVPDPASDRLILKVSKVGMPTRYEYKDVLKIASDNRDKGALLGIGPFGPVYWNIHTQLTHAIIAGATGSGKTSFAHFLLSQLVAFQDCAVHIIDPKRIDYQSYSDCPSVGMIASTPEEIRALIRLLVVELETRKDVFKQAFFPHAPQNLNEYKAMRAKYNPDLPEIKRTIVFIDEYVSASSNNSNFSSFDSSGVGMRVLIRQGRALGIHLVCLSQSLHHFVFTDFEGLDRFMFFGAGHSPFSIADDKKKSIEHKAKRIPGRLFVDVATNESSMLCQAPEATPEVGYLVASRFNKKEKLDNYGFIRLNTTTYSLLSDKDDFDRIRLSKISLSDEYDSYPRNRSACLTMIAKVHNITVKGFNVSQAILDDKNVEEEINVAQMNVRRSRLAATEEETNRDIEAFLQARRETVRSEVLSDSEVSDLLACVNGPSIGGETQDEEDIV